MCIPENVYNRALVINPYVCIPLRLRDASVRIFEDRWEGGGCGVEARDGIVDSSLEGQQIHLHIVRRLVDVYLLSECAICSEGVVP